MVQSVDVNVGDLVAIAERLGKERDELEARNKRRRAKGRKPLPDAQEKADAEVLRIKYRTGDATTVDGAQALRLYEMRKAAMSGLDQLDDDDEQPIDGHIDNHPKIQPAPPPPRQQDPDAERAQREAEAVRRVQDMKSGRIDHAGNWSDGQKLEGGDDTSFPSSGQVWGSGGREDEGGESPESMPEATENCENPENPENPGNPEKPARPARQKKIAKASNVSKGLMPAAGLNEFRSDLYERLRVSFEGLETTLSDMQGRLNEVVTASAAAPVPSEAEGGKDEFEKLLSRKVPVTFDVGGTKMTFDAVTVFHASPCITVVSKSGSATIMPKPGARLNLTYDMDGEKYVDDPVTFLGTRFDLPMFGLSFVGFIRDLEADMIDSAAGVQEV